MTRVLKGQYLGGFTRDELFQTLVEDKQWFIEKGIDTIINAELRFTAGNEYFERVILLRADGSEVQGYKRRGAYRCAADFYGALTAEDDIGPASTTTSQSSSNGTGEFSGLAVPFSPL